MQSHCLTTSNPGRLCRSVSGRNSNPHSPKRHMTSSTFIFLILWHGESSRSGPNSGFAPLSHVLMALSATDLVSQRFQHERSRATSLRARGHGSSLMSSVVPTTGREPALTCNGLQCLCHSSLSPSIGVHDGWPLLLAA